MQKQKSEHEFPETGFSGVVEGVGSRALNTGVLGHPLEGKESEELEKARPFKGAALSNAEEFRPAWDGECSVPLE